MPPPPRRVHEPPRYADWAAGGERVDVRSRDKETRKLFCRKEGRGPWTTFLHSFPTSSWDWANVARQLPPGRTRLYPDLLGFGASDKPAGYRYSLLEQLDLLLQVWKHYRVQSTLLVVHDYTVSLAQEILARQREGSYAGPNLQAIAFLNGGLFWSRTRLLPIQRLLYHPWIGPFVARLSTLRTFERAMRRISAPGHPPPRAQPAQHWSAMIRGGGRAALARLARYGIERKANEARWSDAFTHATVPLYFLWGTHDPLAGAHMVSRIRQAAPHASVHEWPDAGHYPHWDVPERVAAHLQELEVSHWAQVSAPTRPRRR